MKLLNGITGRWAKHSMLLYAYLERDNFKHEPKSEEEIKSELVGRPQLQASDGEIRALAAEIHRQQITRFNECLPAGDEVTAE